MNRYRVTVSATETRSATKELTFEVKADSPESAESAAYADVHKHVRFCTIMDDFEHETTEADVLSIELIEGEGGNKDVIPRCKKTPDMFPEGAR